MIIFKKVFLFSWRAYWYIHYRWHSKGRHGTHSPFAYHFIEQIIKAPPTQIGGEIEALRKKCLQNQQKLNLIDYGAGYNGDGKIIRQKTIRQVTLSSSRQRKAGELLYQICLHYQPQRLLELGTNLGFSALYLAAGMPNSAHLTTIEGDPTLAQFAREHIRLFSNKNTTVLNGEFDTVLDDLLINKPIYDFLFLDGKHTYTATLHYFERLLPYLAPQSIIILDDIYWSPGMRKAWLHLIQQPIIQVSIDLYQLGILFIGRKQKKQHFVLKF